MGEEIIPFNESEARQVVEELMAEKVDGIAVGFLWSFLNRSHELMMRDIVQKMCPGLPVAMSSEVAPIMREYPRFITTIIDLYIGRALRDLLHNIESRLKQYGYTRPLLVMQAIGGVSRADVVKPSTTLHSGPVGGLIGVEFLKNIYGYKNAMGGDVGGTSFDITVSPEKGEQFLREPVVGRWEIANPMREIITIGAGGGTIAWIDQISGMLHVGPQSAGAEPGPVCYGTGGALPTVTDADVVMNRIDPDYFLGGKRRLDKDKALTAIQDKIATPLGMDVYQAAEAISRIIDSSMEATLRSTMAIKGLDPEDYVLFNFGGAGSAHCAGYSAGIGFRGVIIPPYAATFSAFGASTSDVCHRYEASPFLLLPDLPFDVTTSEFDLEKLKSMAQIPDRVSQRFNSMFAELESKAYTDMNAEGFNKEQITIKYELLARYGGQLWEIRCPSPVSRINSISDIKSVICAFEEEYLRIYTREAMVPAGGLEVISLALESSAPAAKPRLVKYDFVSKDAAPALKYKREVYFDGRFVKTRIYQMDRLRAGNVIEGEAIIEGSNTTLVVPVDRRVIVDEYLNMVMEYI